MIGEFDDEFLEEIKAMDPSPEQDSDMLCTVPSEVAHNALVAKEQHDIAEAKKTKAANRRRTYLSSEIPVRPCDDNCPKRLTCRDFNNGRVMNGDLCKPELRQIKKWQVAFRKGELDKIKDDAGAVAGALAVQIYRLIEQAIIDGAVVESTKEGRFGTYTEKMAHPALQQAANICKTLGISLQEFMMTPKAAKDVGPQVQVNVGVSFAEVQNRFAARYGQADGSK